MASDYDYIITPYMTHKGHLLFLEKLAKRMGAQLIFHNSYSLKPKLFDLFLYFRIFGMNDFKHLFFSAKQRQMRRSATGQLSRPVALLFLLRGIYQALGMYSFAKNKNILFFPTAEPYVEAFSIRMVAKALPHKACFCYYSRDFVSIQEDKLDYAPTNRDFDALQKLLKRCSDPNLNPKFSEGELSKTYNVGGQLVGCMNEIGVENRHSVDGAYVIFLHDFFDAPGVFGPGLFDSLVDWFEFTIKILRKTDKKFFIKPHPNQLEKSRDLLADLIVKHGLEDQVLSGMSSSQIIESDVFGIVTNHGSVALEALAYGRPCVFTGESLITILGIDERPRSKEAYRDKLLSPVEPSFCKETITSFIHQINAHEFSYKYLIPIAYSKHPKFLEENPINDSDLRKICEQSDFYYKLLHETLGGDDFEKLYKALTIKTDPCE